MGPADFFVGRAIGTGEFCINKPLRNMEEVATDMIDLEEQAEGLIADVFGDHV